jgi:1-phosphofructokinase family hexose kinase
LLEAKMILTVTPNPAVDQTMWLEQISLGAVNRVAEAQLDPAGKGINVSRVAHRLGCPTLAFGFLAGEAGEIIERLLDEEEVLHYFVRVPGQTRLNVTFMEASGRATSLYGPGPSVREEHLAELQKIVCSWLQSARVLVLAGSLPPGAPASTYASYISAARTCGVPVLLDADGETLRQGIAAGPDLIKPNLAEAERLLGRELRDLAAVEKGARELSLRGIPTVVLSMRDQGAICAQGERVWRVIPPTVKRRSTVGSGDSMVAGLAVTLARGGDILEGLRVGAAAGAATAAAPGTLLGTAAEIEAFLPEVRIEPL